MTDDTRVHEYEYANAALQSFARARYKQEASDTRRWALLMDRGVSLGSRLSQRHRLQEHGQDTSRQVIRVCRGLYL